MILLSHIELVKIEPGYYDRFCWNSIPIVFGSIGSKMDVPFVPFCFFSKGQIHLRTAVRVVYWHTIDTTGRSSMLYPTTYIHIFSNSLYYAQFSAQCTVTSIAY